MLDLHSAGLAERETLAAELAQWFATDQLGMDDAFWERLHDAFSDDELIQLGLCVGLWLAFGRLNQVLGVDRPAASPDPHGPDHPHCVPLTLLL